MLYPGSSDATAIHYVIWLGLTVRYVLWLVEEGSDDQGNCGASMPHLPWECALRGISG